MKLFLVILIALSFVGPLQGFWRRRDEEDAYEEGRVGYGPGAQDWGFYSVRNDAKLFYWLFYTRATNLDSPYDRPLVVWLGGDESSNLVNFGEIGPLFVNGTERPSSRVNHVNLMFVDSIAGSGFSYVYDRARYATNIKEIGTDVVQFFIKFYNNHPKFSTVPVYIFGESFGGKIAVEVAKQLGAAIKRNRLQADFRGIGLQNPLISPIDLCLSWGPYLVSTGFVDFEEYDKIEKDAQLVQVAFYSQNYKQATDRMMDLMHDIVLTQTGDIDIYNIYNPDGSIRTLYDNITALMQNDVAKALGIIDSNTFDVQIETAVEKLEGDFIKPVTSVVEELLNSTNLKVVVYNGQLDVVVNPLGTLKWVDRLQWSGSSGWKIAKRHPLILNEVIEGYFKNYENLHFYWINRAGNKVPKDNPGAAIEVLRRVTEFDKRI